METKETKKIKITKDYFLNLFPSKEKETFVIDLGEKCLTRKFDKIQDQFYKNKNKDLNLLSDTFDFTIENRKISFPKSEQDILGHSDILFLPNDFTIDTFSRFNIQKKMILIIENNSTIPPCKIVEKLLDLNLKKKWIYIIPLNFNSEWKKEEEKLDYLDPIRVILLDLFEKIDFIQIDILDLEIQFYSNGNLYSQNGYLINEKYFTRKIKIKPMIKKMFQNVNIMTIGIVPVEENNQPKWKIHCCLRESEKKKLDQEHLFFDDSFFNWTILNDKTKIRHE